MGHATLSPSAAERWMSCPGSVVLSDGIADKSSEFADEGTAAHFLAAKCLQTGNNTKDYLWYEIYLCRHEPSGEHFECFKSDPADYELPGVDVLNSFIVDHDMAEFVRAYVDRTRAIGGELFVEQRLSISHLTNESDAYGTSDAVIVTEDGELVIRDLKYGRGVKVDATENKQLKIYALAALAEYELLYDIKTVRLCIDQPRLGHVSEWTLPVEQLRAFEEDVQKAAAMVDMAWKYGKAEDKIDIYLKPSEDACTWCRAKADCPALRRHVLATVSGDFIDESQPIAEQLEDISERTVDNVLLGNLLKAVPLIEDFCKAIRAKAEGELFAGRAVPGWKLVEGRRGARSWANPEEAEQVLKSMRLKVEEMYDLKLISPTTAEKLAKAGTIGPRQWPKLQDFITQPEGKPSVAPESDKRPALVIAAVDDEFETVADDVSDLF